MPGPNSGYTLDGQYMFNYSTIKLLNASNFGTTGTYPKKINVSSSYVDSNSLTAITGISDIDLFYFGNWDRNDPSLNQFTDKELDSLYKWSLYGGKMIIGAAADTNPIAPFYKPDILNSRWGFGVEFKPSANIKPTTDGSASIIFDGPFGIVSSANQGGSVQGIFNVVPSNIIVLGEDNATGKPTLILDCKTLDLILSDADAHTSLGGITSGDFVINDNDRFWVNTIAYMDELQDPPVITQNGDILSTGTYSRYQWYKDGSLIDDATSSSYHANESGNYTVEVDLECGCKDVPSKTFNFVYTGIDEKNSNITDFSVYPNPTSKSTTVSISLNQADNVSVEVFDISGKEIKTIYNGNLSAGKHQFNLSFANNPGQMDQSGVYFVKIIGDQIYTTKKIILVN